MGLFSASKVISWSGLVLFEQVLCFGGEEMHSAQQVINLGNTTIVLIVYPFLPTITSISCHKQDITHSTRSSCPTNTTGSKKVLSTTMYNLTSKKSASNNAVNFLFFMCASGFLSLAGKSMN